MNDSHASSRDLYDASGPALEAMLAAGRSQPGCLGGRFIGAGFAGCALFLVRSSQTRQFVAGAADLFVKQTGLTPDLGVVRAASGARSGPWPPR
jgi:galactokinase